VLFKQFSPDIIVSVYDEGGVAEIIFNCPNAQSVCGSVPGGYPEGIKQK